MKKNFLHYKKIDIIMTQHIPNLTNRQMHLELTSSDHYYLVKAAEESYNSNMGSKHGCVAVINGKIIGRGHNSNRTQSVDGFIRNTCSCHAEIAAVRNIWHQNNCGSKYKGNPWVLPRQGYESNFQKSSNLCCAYG